MHLWGQHLSTSPWRLTWTRQQHRCLHASPQRRDGIPAPGGRSSLLLTEGLTSHRRASDPQQTQQSEAMMPLPSTGEPSTNVSQRKLAEVQYVPTCKCGHGTAWLPNTPVQPRPPTSKEFNEEFWVKQLLVPMLFRMQNTELALRFV